MGWMVFENSFGENSFVIEKMFYLSTFYLYVISLQKFWKNAEIKERVFPKGKTASYE